MSATKQTSATYLNYMNSSSGEFVYNSELSASVEAEELATFIQVRIVERPVEVLGSPEVVEIRRDTARDIAGTADI